MSHACATLRAVSIDDYEHDAWGDPDNEASHDDDEMREWAQELRDDIECRHVESLHERSNAAREAAISGCVVPWNAIHVCPATAAEWLAADGPSNLARIVNYTPVASELTGVRDHLGRITSEALTLPPDSLQQVTIRKCLRALEAEHAKFRSRLEVCAADHFASFHTYGVEHDGDFGYFVETVDQRVTERALRLLALGASRARALFALAELSDSRSETLDRLAAHEVERHVTRRPRPMCERIRPRPPLSMSHASQAPPLVAV